MGSVEQRRRLLLADDHIIVSQAIEALLAPSYSCVEMVHTGRDLFQAIKQQPKAELVVAELHLAGESTLDVIHAANDRGNPIPFLILTSHANAATAADALSRGAAGYLLKCATAAELKGALHAVLNGQKYLSPALRKLPRLTTKQQQILDGVVRGMSAKRIAAEMGRSTRSVEAHKYQVMQILGVHTTMGLVIEAMKSGLVNPMTGCGRWTSDSRHVAISSTAVASKHLPLRPHWPSFQASSDRVRSRADIRSGREPANSQREVVECKWTRR